MKKVVPVDVLGPIQESLKDRDVTRAVEMTLRNTGFRDWPLSLKYSVLAAYVEAGEFESAKSASEHLFGEYDLNIPPEVKVLNHRIAHGIESLRLGQAIYPEEYPMWERWRFPSKIPLFHGFYGALKSWGPAKVKRIGRKWVELLFAYGSISSPYLETLTVSTVEWCNMQPFGLTPPSDFFFLANYTDGAAEAIFYYP